MDPEAISKLTEAQREVLRRWHLRQSAKEIALELGITHWAVNERLRAARRTLRAASSHEASQILARFEAGETYKRVVYDPPAVADRPLDVMMDVSEDAGEWPSRPGRADAVHEEQVPYRVTASSWNGPRLPIPRYEGDRNDLTVAQRLLWIALAAFGIIVAVGTLVTISAGAGQTVVAIGRALS